MDIAQRLQSRDDFEAWLASMDEMLEDFIQRFPSVQRQQLNFSPLSLDVVELWILGRYPTSDAVLVASESGAANGAACYIGESFRKAIGGKWTINLNNPEFVFYGMPILTDSKGLAAPICPLTMVTATANRRTGHFLKTILNSAIERNSRAR